MPQSAAAKEIVAAPAAADRERSASDKRAAALMAAAAHGATHGSPWRQLNISARPRPRWTASRQHEHL